MSEIEDSVEYQHRLLEAQPNRELHSIQIGAREHSISLPVDGSLTPADQKYLVERASALRWVTGPGEMKIDHPQAQEILVRAFSETGSHAFEFNLFRGITPKEGPADRKSGMGPVTLFLDFGGSSMKGLLFSNEQLARQYSEGWEPFQMTNMEQLVSRVDQFVMELLGGRAPEKINHVGISSAGLCDEGAILVTTLTQSMTFTKEAPYDPWFLKRFFQELFPQASYALINDGAVTSLPIRKGQNRLKKVISLVMGSNLGGGHSSEPGVHELGFVPCVSNTGAIDEWSGYPGIGTTVFSKTGLLCIATEHGYENGEEREIIDQLHTDLRHGLRPARLVFQSFGAQLAPFILFLQRFYGIDEVLLSGGILTASVVDEMRKPYVKTYRKISGEVAPSLRMLVVPGVLPEYNQVWNLAMNHFSQTQS